MFLTEFTTPYSLKTQRGWHTSELATFSWEQTLVFNRICVFIFLCGGPLKQKYVAYWKPIPFFNNHWLPSSALEVNNERSCKFFPLVIRCHAQVKLYFIFRHALSILKIEHNTNVEVCLISLRSYLCSYYILRFMYISKENKLDHDTILSVA